MSPAPRRQSYHSGPEALIALVPHLLGFHPTQSVVCASLRGDRGRVGLVARVDLDDLSETANTLATHLLKDGANYVATIWYTDQTDDELTPHVEALGNTFTQYNLDHLQAWVMDDTTYRQWGHPDTRRPRSELDDTGIAQEYADQQEPLAATRADLGKIEPASNADRLTAAESAAMWEVTGGQEGKNEDVLNMWLRQLDTGDIGPLEAGVIAVAATRNVLLRDAMLLTLTDPDADDTARQVVLGQNVTIGDWLGKVMTPGGIAPGERARSGLRVLRAIASYVKDEDAVAVLTLLGFLAWWSADSTRGTVLIERVLNIDPNYRLAGLLHASLTEGMPPGWHYTA